MQIERSLIPFISEDLQEKVILLAGPRQCGKTTLARELLPLAHPLYLNWDRQEDRVRIRKAQWPAEPTTLLLDELHKMTGWKNFLKGQFDTFKKHHRFLVTGSARLDLFRKSGDSLQGRYHLYHLHPFSLNELAGVTIDESRLTPFKPLEFREQSSELKAILERLLKFGGFPEPYLKQDERELRRWQIERLDRLVKEDIRDLEHVYLLDKIEQLALRLEGYAGQLLSINHLREDLEVTHRTVTHWVGILEKFYHLFRISPYSTKNSRMLKKEPKVFLWDYSAVPEFGAKLENCVASHLLKFRDVLIDRQGYRASLHFLRDKEKREVDFLFCVDNKPWFAVEVKTKQSAATQAMHYFKERVKIPFAYQVYFEGETEYLKDGIHHLSADRFLSALI